MIFKQRTMKNIKILIFLSIFSLVTYFWFSNKDNFLMSNIDSKQGIYEFTEWNEDELYRLKGEWEFYPKQFIDENQSDFDSKQYQTVEHLWTQDPNFNHGFGYASYRLNISGLDPNKQYGLLLEEAGSSYELYVNGRLILSNGKVSNNIENAINENYTDKGVFFSDSSGNANIVIHISNFVKINSGFNFAPLLSSYERMINYYETTMIIELFVFSAMFSLGLIFLLITLIVKDHRSFFMAILTFLFSIRIISIGNHLIYVLNPYINLPLIWIIRFEYLSVYLMLPAFLFLINTFKIYKSDFYFKSAIVLSTFFTIVSLISNQGQLELLYYVFQFLIGLFGLQLIYSCYMALKKGIIDLLSVIALFITISLALVLNFVLQDFRNSFYYMVMIFTLFIAASVIYRFSVISERTIHLESIVKIDPLTKLWNRSYLNDLKQNGLKFDQEDYLFVLFIDLNEFKQINDEYGHKIGDEVLRIAARRLRNSCHDSDQIIRYGGDEFLIFANMKDSNSIEKVIKRIRDNFVEPFSIGDIKINLSLAIGYHPFNPREDDLETIIAFSDKKMYEDKRSQANL